MEITRPQVIFSPSPINISRWILSTRCAVITGLNESIKSTMEAVASYLKVGVVTASLALTGCAADNILGGSAEYEVCEKQITDITRQKFDQAVTGIDWDYAKRRPALGTIPPKVGRTLVYVDKCPGFHVFEVRGTEFDCRFRAHFGTPPSYVYYRQSLEGCP